MPFQRYELPQGRKEALADAFRYTFFHWGIHAWAVYALIALAPRLLWFRKKREISFIGYLKALVW